MSIPPSASAAARDIPGHRRSVGKVARCGMGAAAIRRDLGARRFQGLGAAGADRDGRAGFGESRAQSPVRSLGCRRIPPRAFRRGRYSSATPLFSKLINSGAMLRGMPADASPNGGHAGRQKSTGQLRFALDRLRIVAITRGMLASRTVLTSTNRSSICRAVDAAGGRRGCNRRSFPIASSTSRPHCSSGTGSARPASRRSPSAPASRSARSITAFAARRCCSRRSCGG